MDTKNLKIRKLTLEDTEKVYALTSLEEVARYMRFDQHENQEQAKQLVEEYLYTPGYEAFVLEERERGAFVGVFVFKPEEQDPSIYSMTTFNHPNFWNKGYGAEILEAMKRYAEEDLTAKSLRAYVVSHNKGSFKILEKNDFKKVQTLTFEDLDGELYIYELQFNQ